MANVGTKARFDRLDVKNLCTFLWVEIDQLGKDKAHIPALVHDGPIAVWAIYFAGQVRIFLYVLLFVKFQRAHAMSEPNIFLMEYRGPLERGACQQLRVRKNSSNFECKQLQGPWATSLWRFWQPWQWQNFEDSGAGWLISYRTDSQSHCACHFTSPNLWSSCLT